MAKRYVTLDVVLPEAIRDKLFRLTGSMGEDMETLVIEAALTNVAEMDTEDAKDIVFDFMREAMRERFTPFPARKRTVIAGAPKKRSITAPVKDKKADKKITQRQNQSVMFAICKKFHDVNPMTTKQWSNVASKELQDILMDADGKEFSEQGKYINTGKLFRKNVGQTYGIGRAKYKFMCDDKKPSPSYWFKKVGKYKKKK